MPGVLVLVEQHHAERAALGEPDLGVVAGDGGGQGHLGGVVERGLGPHAGGDRVHQVREFLPVALDLGGSPEPRGGGRLLPRTGREGRDEGRDQVRVSAQVVGADEVVGQLPGQGQHVAGHRAGVRSGGQRALPPRHHVVGELEGGSRGEQPRVGFDGYEQSVGAEQGAGEGVIGGDLRVLGADRLCDRGVRAGPGAQRAAGEGVQSAAYPPGQLLGGLTGEGQAEDLPRSRVSVGHQPHDPGRHGLRLAGARPGQHESGFGRPGDHLGLLRGGSMDAECVGDGGGVDRRGHPLTCFPSGCAGQLDLTLQCSHHRPTRAV